jgi:hypothetical protein
LARASLDRADENLNGKQIGTDSSAVHLNNCRDLEKMAIILKIGKKPK